MKLALQVDSSLTPSTAQITWSVWPSVGSVSNSGTYIAPSTVSSAQKVNLVVLVVPANVNLAPVVAYSTVQVLPPVSVAVSPGTKTLGAGGTTQFGATVNNSPGSTGVTWSISPAVGNISSSGLYTAPTSISAQQSVTITATSTAVTSAKASATLTLLAPGTLNISPATASLSSGQTEQFGASFSNGAPSSVNWSISPAVGSISSSGLYTAPSSISAQQTITVSASSIGAPNTASAHITLLPQSTVVLPIEVMGANGTTASAQLNVPSGTNVSGNVTLALQIHGLEYQTQASVKVNNSSWIPINSTNAQIQGLAASYGGIGGGFNTLSMLIPLPAGTVQTGANTVTFQFVGTDGNSSGYRVLSVNFQLANGTQAVPASQFSQDDPSNWTAPSTAASDIAAGKSLYQSAAIFQPQLGGSPKALKAHCGDCHTVDGRDLKYFNYSNNSIYQRAVWHGLNSTEAQQIVSYIRSLNTPAPSNARPWNPPYQPGPGLDSAPVENWSAGAGLSTVLSSDQAMQATVAPTLTSSDFNQTGYLNTREMQIALQLPDWNHWLPRIHPLDAWGNNFAQSAYYADYNKVRADMSPGNATAYYNARYDIQQWGADRADFLTMWQSYGSSPWTLSQTTAVYSTALWQLTKEWEIMHEFDLEGFGQTYANLSAADARAWPDATPFMTSPNMLHIPPGSPGVGNGQMVTDYYHSYMWYHLQLILNNGNGAQDGPYPIDWGYVYGFLKNLDHGSSQVPDGMLQLAWLEKALQLSYKYPGSPSNNQTGWNPGVNDLSRLVHPDWQPMWAATSASTESKLLESYLLNWLQAAKAYPASAYYAGGWASASEVPNSSMDGDFGSKLWYSIPRFKYYGVSQSTINTLAAWAQTVWPNANWNVLTSETCTAGSPGNVNCPY